MGPYFSDDDPTRQEELHPPPRGNLEDGDLFVQKAKRNLWEEIDQGERIVVTTSPAGDVYVLTSSGQKLCQRFVSNCSSLCQLSNDFLLLGGYCSVEPLSIANLGWERGSLSNSIPLLKDDEIDVTAMSFHRSTETLALGQKPSITVVPEASSALGGSIGSDSGVVGAFSLKFETAVRTEYTGIYARELLPPSVVSLEFFSPEVLVSAYSDCSLRAWDLSNAKLLSVVEGDPSESRPYRNLGGRVRSGPRLALDPISGAMYVASSLGGLECWDLRTPEPVEVLQGYQGAKEFRCLSIRAQRREVLLGLSSSDGVMLSFDLRKMDPWPLVRFDSEDIHGSPQCVTHHDSIAGYWASDKEENVVIGVFSSCTAGYDGLTGTLNWKQRAHRSLEDVCVVRRHEEDHGVIGVARLDLEERIGWIADRMLELGVGANGVFQVVGAAFVTLVVFPKCWLE